MSDVPQVAAEDVTLSAVEHHVLDILNPSLHHHDLLQSYVRAEVGSDSKQDPDEFEEPSREGHSGKYHPTATSGGNARPSHDKGKKSNDKKEKGRSDIESEIRIQKSRRK